MQDQKDVSQCASALEPHKHKAQRQSKNLTSQTGDDKFAYLRVFAMRKVEFFLDRGRHVDGADLVAALREQAGEPIPPKVLDHLCRHLEGKVTKPKGRKAIPGAEEHRRLMFIRHHYRRDLAWLQARKKRYGGLDGWPSIRQADWWRGPPNERAARMTAHRWLYGAESWRSVHNLVSSRKYRPVVVNAPATA